MNNNDVATIAGIDPLLVDSALKGCLCDPESLSFREGYIYANGAQYQDEHLMVLLYKQEDGTVDCAFVSPEVITQLRMSASVEEKDYRVEFDTEKRMTPQIQESVEF